MNDGGEAQILLGNVKNEKASSDQKRVALAAGALYL